MEEEKLHCKGKEKDDWYHTPTHFGVPTFTMDVLLSVFKSDQQPANFNGEFSQVDPITGLTEVDP